MIYLVHITVSVTDWYGTMYVRLFSGILGANSASKRHQSHLRSFPLIVRTFSPVVTPSKTNSYRPYLTDRLLLRFLRLTLHHRLVATSSPLLLLLLLPLPFSRVPFSWKLWPRSSSWSLSFLPRLYFQHPLPPIPNPSTTHTHTQLVPHLRASMRRSLPYVHGYI